MDCDIVGCKRKINYDGGLLFSPPDKDDCTCVKFHICGEHCNRMISTLILGHKKEIINLD